MGKKSRLVILLFSIGVLIIYFFTSNGNTPFNHFTLLADSFLKGKIYIEGIYPWLEKIPIDANNWYVANPPMPAILLLPFVYLFGIDFPQQYLAHLLGAGIVALTMFLSYKIKKDMKLMIWSGFLIGLGSIIWYLSSGGSVWYLGQVTSAFFLFWAIYETLNKSRLFLMGVLLGCSYLSRIPTILALPFFIINLKKVNIKNISLLISGLLIFVTLNGLYNYLRFGVFWDIGYTLIPGISTEPWYQKGIIHPTYILEHLKIIFLRIPEFENNFLYFKPSLFGYAIWFTTPAFLFSVFNKIKEKVVWSTWLSIILISILIFSHGSTGFSQFGYRFAVDFYPFLTYLTISGIANLNGPKWYHWLLLIVGILINTWGVLWINKFNWIN
jgi:hypothetical protein